MKFQDAKILERSDFPDGITFEPASKSYYKHYPYKLQISHNFRGLVCAEEHQLLDTMTAHTWSEKIQKHIKSQLGDAKPKGSKRARYRFGPPKRHNARITSEKMLITDDPIFAEEKAYGYYDTVANRSAYFSTNRRYYTESEQKEAIKDLLKRAVDWDRLRVPYRRWSLTGIYSAVFEDYDDLVKAAIAINLMPGANIHAIYGPVSEAQMEQLEGVTYEIEYVDSTDIESYGWHKQYPIKIKIADPTYSEWYWRPSDEWSRQKATLMTWFEEQLDSEEYIFYNQVANSFIVYMKSQDILEEVVPFMVMTHPPTDNGNEKYTTEITLRLPKIL